MTTWDGSIAASVQALWQRLSGWLGLDRSLDPVMVPVERPRPTRPRRRS